MDDLPGGVSQLTQLQVGVVRRRALRLLPCATTDRSGKLRRPMSRAHRGVGGGLHTAHVDACAASAGSEANCSVQLMYCTVLYGSVPRQAPCATDPS
eukprot:366084-Chlamydomonas_euryale.AAC.2